MLRSIPIVLLGLWLLATSQAYGYYIQGYAVDYHRSCGANNLPGTIRELNRFFNSEHFPADAQQNFLYTDAQVKQVDWHRDTDFYSSDATTSGHDGVDSGLLSYIASHGVTSQGIYTALSGNREEGGCHMKNSEMTIGDNQARYLILSTCQGLKIGTGDRPSRPGENPVETWENAAPGMNCIFGYSNNMVDASGYGEYFLENLATSDDTLADAFFKASRAVSYSNIPAVMCYGTDEENARYHLENDRRFTDVPNGTAAAVFEFQDSRYFETAHQLPLNRPFPATINLKPLSVDVSTISRKMLGTSVKNLGSMGYVNVYQSELGTVTFHKVQGVLQYSRLQRGAAGPGKGVSDGVAIKIVRQLMEGLGVDAQDLKLSYIIDHGYGTKAEKGSSLVGKTVVLHQKFHELLPLGTRGSVEVSIDNLGEVTGFTIALVEKAEAAKGLWVTVDSSDFLVEKAGQALAAFNEKFPDSKVKVVDVKLGYDVGHYYSLNRSSKATAQVLIEVQKSNFARRYIENITL